MTVKVGDTITATFTGTVHRVGDSGMGNGLYVYVTTADGEKLWLTPRQYQVATEEES